MICMIHGIRLINASAAMMAGEAIVIEIEAVIEIETEIVTRIDIGAGAKNENVRQFGCCQFTDNKVRKIFAFHSCNVHLFWRNSNI